MDPFLGEIKLVSFNFPPKGWALCNGQLLPINQNQALFALLGTTYGGNGQTNFALPNLRGRVPVHMGDMNPLGTAAGASSVTLTQAQLPAHMHQGVQSNALATSNNPAGAMLGKKGRLGRDLYAAPSNVSHTAATASTPIGGGQPHNNMQPYLVLNAVIALQGIFPSMN
jgi:microcystin-dependent protein